MTFGTPPLISVVIPTRNAFAQTACTVSALLEQRLPDQARMEIIVIDDASTDGTADRIIRAFASRITLLRQTGNLGRSATCNFGARMANGHWLAILDCDCVPLSTDYLAQFISALDDKRICLGAIHYQGDGFWPHYQRLGARRRLDAHHGGEPAALSTANMALDRQVFLDAGGYDENYRRYGFEDRDLLWRLHDQGITAHYVESAGTQHEDGVNLRTLMVKNAEAARYTAPRFRATHPDAFSRLGYARIDATLHPVRTRLLAILGWLLFPLARMGERFLQWERIPLTIRLAVAQGFLASAYGLGSVRAQRESSRG